MRLSNRKNRFPMSRSVTLCLALSVLPLTVFAAPLLARPAIISGMAYVIDGDTLVIHKRHVRLFGVDAFERDQTCGRFRCGAEARKALRDLTKGRTLTCETKAVDTYGRTVAVCKTSDGRDLGSEMVRRGLAVAYRSFSTQYLGDESYAKSHHLGAWGYGFESPLQYRRKER